MKIISDDQVNQVCGGDFASGEAAGEQTGKELAKALAADSLIYNALKLFGVF